MAEPTVTPKYLPKYPTKIPQRRTLPLNPNGSMRAYDPHSKDLNDYTDVADLAEKNQMIIKFVEDHWGQTLDLVNIKDGRIQPVYFGPTGPDAGLQTPARATAARAWATYVLFGTWRIASEEDIAKDDEKSRIEHARLTAIEAKRMAKAAGLMFKEVSEAAGAIVKHNQAMDKQELAEEVKEPTDAELDEMHKKILAAKKARAEKAKAEKDNPPSPAA